MKRRRTEAVPQSLTNRVKTPPEVAEALCQNGSRPRPADLDIQKICSEIVSTLSSLETDEDSFSHNGCISEPQLVLRRLHDLKPSALRSYSPIKLLSSPAQSFIVNQWMGNENPSSVYRSFCKSLLMDKESEATQSYDAWSHLSMISSKPSNTPHLPRCPRRKRLCQTSRKLSAIIQLGEQNTKFRRKTIYTLIRIHRALTNYLKINEVWSCGPDPRLNANNNDFNKIKKCQHICYGILKLCLPSDMSLNRDARYIFNDVPVAVKEVEGMEISSKYGYQDTLYEYLFSKPHIYHPVGYSVKYCGTTIPKTSPCCVKYFPTVSDYFSRPEAHPHFNGCIFKISERIESPSGCSSKDHYVVGLSWVNGETITVRLLFLITFSYCVKV